METKSRWTDVIIIGLFVVFVAIAERTRIAESQAHKPTAWAAPSGMP